MKSQIEMILHEYESQYLKIFRNFYPADGSTGFTEQNQSVNFCNAFEKIYKNAFTWYEAPFKDNSNNHFDAIVVNPEEKEIFIVESKRFSNPNQKLLSVGQDIRRILNRDNRTQIIKRLNDNDEELYSVYGVILADAWYETKIKREICDLWEDGFFYKDHIIEKLKLDNNDLHKVKSNIEIMKKINFKETTVNKSIYDKYNLLLCVWKL